MKLIKVVIKKYKNIQDQTFDFQYGGNFCALIGQNGSGKSNLLEAISKIFAGLLVGADVDFDFSVEYEIDGQNYVLSHKDIIKGKANEKVRLPSSVIACYSGEDVRLWEGGFENYYMGFFNDAVKKNSFSPVLLYVNKYCWKISLISLLMCQKQNVKTFLSDILHISNLNDIKICFYVDKNKKLNFSKHNALKWIERVVDLQEEDGININSFATIETFNTTFSNISETVFHYLYLLSLPEKNKKKKQNIDKYITDIKLLINGIDFDSLSEGEKKMILIECIANVLGDEHSLILLDEPDSHVHVEYKKVMLDSIRDFSGFTLFTTHSPIICNLLNNQSDVKFLQNGRVVNTSQLDSIRKLSGNEIKYFDGALALGAKYLLVTEGIYDTRYFSKALEIFERRDARFRKLRSVGVLFAGGAGDAMLLYNDVIVPRSSDIEKVIFLFDYDKAGLDAYKKILEVSKTLTNVEAIFYQKDYSIPLDITRNNVDQQDSILVEDLFDSSSYAVVFSSEPTSMEPTYKYFRCRQKVLEKIKKQIQENYRTFSDDVFADFAPLLDKLLSIYGL